MAKRIQRRRTSGWRMPPDTVYVGRPTRFGNPFRHPEPAVAVEAYRRWLIEHMNELAPLIRQRLTGKDLACWCPLDAPCHADVLLQVAAGQPLTPDC